MRSNSLALRFSRVGVALSPEDWRQMLRTVPSSDRVLVDVRNDYEWQIGAN